VIRTTWVIVVLALRLFVWSPAAHAQQPAKIPLIAILADENPALASFFEPFVQGLRDRGWAEGQNITFERRYAEGDKEAFASLAAELVRLRPVSSSPSAHWLREPPRQRRTRFRSSLPGPPIQSASVSSRHSPGREGI